MRYAIALLLIAGMVAVSIWQYGENSGTVEVSNVTSVVVDHEAGHVIVLANFENGAIPDILVGVSSPVAESATLEARGGHDTLAIPAGSTPVLSDDGAFIVLRGLSGDLLDGRLIPVTFRFRHTGDVTTQARLRSVTDPLADPHAGHDMSVVPRLTASNTMAPRLELSISQNPDGTHTVHAETWNFVFESATADFLDGAYCGDGPVTGHGHLYLNGLKLQRMYDLTAVIGQLPPGDYEVTVELNDSLHNPVENADGQVIATARITAP